MPSYSFILQDELYHSAYIVENYTKVNILVKLCSFFSGNGNIYCIANYLSSWSAWVDPDTRQGTPTFVRLKHNKNCSSHAGVLSREEAASMVQPPDREISSNVSQYIVGFNAARKWMLLVSYVQEKC